MKKDSFDEKLLLSRANDASELARRKFEPAFFGFLTEAERAYIEHRVDYDRESIRLVFYGGYDDAEHTVAGFFPSFLFYDESYSPKEAFPICMLHARGSGFRKLSHRDFLGSLMSCGIKRETVGDIAVADDGFSAYVFCLEKTADYLLMSFVSAANDKIVCKKCSANEISLPERKFEALQTTVSSPRLDAILCAALRISREEASNKIESGDVAINHVACFDKSKLCACGSIISVRHHGRFLVADIGDKNRRDRLRITLHKYI